MQFRMLLLLAVPLWAGIAPVAAQGASSSTAEGAKVPRAVFSASPFDFGKVMPSAIQRHDFIVTNVGRELLVISAVEPGCGCTTAGEWDHEIAPGKSG